MDKLSRQGRKRYWPWAAFAGAALLIGGVVAAFSIALASRNRPMQTAVFVGFTVTAAVMTALLVRFRDRYDYFVETDGREWISRWSPAGEVLIRREDVVNVKDDGGAIVIEAKNGTIIVSRACSGFTALKNMAAEWGSVRR
ncbi:MAG: hypothetical protein QOC81_1689 [Thermoanaerobaculia bacterium]|jgi:hypothetical protein|nr:hypothetical protein [Thermoanaerobaculia bacterium]